MKKRIHRIASRVRWAIVIIALITGGLKLSWGNGQAKENAKVPPVRFQLNVSPMDRELPLKEHAAIAPREQHDLR